MTQCQTKIARKRAPSAATARPWMSRADASLRAPARPFAFRSNAQDLLPAGVMHDFSRISVHPPRIGATLADVSACASDRYGVNGETGCDTSTGTTVTTIHDPPACYRHCVDRHEAVHARDIGPCCKRANVASKTAKSDDDKQAVQDKFEKWLTVDSNVDWLECRAYKESAKCGREYLNKNCGYSIEEGAPQSASGQGDKPSFSQALQGPGEPTPMAAEGEPTSFASNGMLAEDKLDGGEGGPAPTDKLDAGKEAPGPEKCCPIMLCYWRVSQGRADNVCGRAPKGLTPCPF